jgi:hypothetical protein
LWAAKLGELEGKVWGALENFANWVKAQQRDGFFPFTIMLGLDISADRPALVKRGIFYICFVMIFEK